ncbi:unnamed protein product [Lactuca saligna]|uniref:Uncharacterized protein n=1 Tax=Lactuca saligna TaxID=75948 RepID=A0AA35VJ39_LACSI|nr:unnamed protein product [Lactuca saligna]
MVPTKLMGFDKDLKVLENSATVFNLALVVLSLLIVLVRKIAAYTWQNRVTKEEADEVGSRVSAVETQFLIVEFGKVYKASVCCCFYVLLLQAVVFCYDGVCLITKICTRGKGCELGTSVLARITVFRLTSLFIIITTISIIIDFSGLILPSGTLVCMAYDELLGFPFGASCMMQKPSF